MALPPAVVAQSTSSIYVGDLHPDVTDGQLADIFAEFNSITSVRLCRDSTTGRSLCYGYVNFASQEEAVHAIETKNHMVLNGKAIRVMWSQRDPDTRKMGVGNIYVKNLVDSIDNAGLQDLFQKFGNIISCKVAISEEGMSKGYGFVQFESEESAKAAIEKLNGSTVGGKQIFVGKFIRKSDRILTGLDAKYTNLYVKNLDSDVTEELLQNKFSKFGKIVSLAIAKDDNGASKGFAFVNFENPDDARQALEAMNGLDLGSRILYVARAQKKAEREQILRHQYEEKRKEKILKYQGSNVYVKNIDDEVTEEELREHFSQCGAITSAKLMRDDKGISRGFGFVCFSNSEEAAKAVNTLHGYMFHRKPLYVAIAQRKEERQAQLQLQFAQHMAGLTGPSAAFIPAAYPRLYYTAPGVVSQVPPHPGLTYPPMGMRPGWRSNGFAPPTRPGFQTSSFPAVLHGSRHQRQNRGRVNGQSHRQVGAYSVAYMPHLQQPTPSVTSSEDLNNQQVKYVPNGHAREVNIGSGVLPAVTHSVGTVSQELESLSSMLAAASPDQQKQLIGERLYPLVQKHKPDLVAKITGMLLEMDNSELLLLLESPESLAAKVKEAVQVLKLSKTKASGQDSLHPSYLSAEVAVN
ncbi:polyadenylate-binding protein 7-like isoform X1 [Tripterygium wilfordii]|uniref:Polyadenylate-binding protein n=1 Tax=Tripterygium wilfordii TaxID=458696 RepID=A0A7J7CTT7_TRIWF|nr:polyadenylate-binding protein 7-like [Tripterygium wilfordii]KAF5737507.1 polyadenylate-binding protein 7-like isoform X1 [Tripterygium wilfordii]